MTMASQMRRNRQKRRAAGKTRSRRPSQPGPGGVRGEHYEPGSKLDREGVRLVNAGAPTGVTRRERIPETTA